MFEGRGFRVPWMLLPLLLLVSVSCGDDPVAPPPAARLPFGVFAVPRGAPGADPLMVEAYSDIERGRFAWSQAEIDWGVCEPQFGTYRWQTLDDHVRQSIRTGVPLSLVVRLVDDSGLGPFPGDLRGQGLGSANVRVRFPVFLRDVVERSRGQLAQLWIGRAVDQRLDLHPDELEPFRALVALAVDSVRSIAPDLPVGTSFTWTGPPSPAALDVLAPHLDQIGWVVLPLDDHFLPSLGPEEAVGLVAEAVASQSELPSVLTEVGYRRVGGTGRRIGSSRGSTPTSSRPHPSSSGSPGTASMTGTRAGPTIGPRRSSRTTRSAPRTIPTGSGPPGSAR